MEFSQELRKFMSLIGPVQNFYERPTDIDWNDAESDLGLSLPTDFKTLVSTIGTGNFGEFTLFNPVSTSRYAKLSKERALLFRKNLEPLLPEVGIRLYPDPAGALQIGRAGRLNLLSRNESDSSRLFWLDEDFRQVHPITHSLLTFLPKLYSGDLTEDWAKTARELIWSPTDPFYNPRPGTYVAKAPNDGRQPL
jgi:hypothetical protein